MYFKVIIRTHPETKEPCGYYRLVESYRTIDDRICHRTLLNIGFLPELSAEEKVQIQTLLTLRSEGKQSLFEPEEKISGYVEKYWHQLIDKKKIDLPEVAQEKRSKLWQEETVQVTEAKELGAEWLCYQAIQQLGIGEKLQQMGWEEEAIQLANTQIISRAVYPFSEYKSARILKENSALCEITNYPIEKLTKDKLYQSALRIYDSKDIIEQHLTHKTNELFDLKDKIILYDLTNTYFEGQKRNSKIAQFGRSKEKRNDAKIVVLALVVNIEGFIKYSNIFEGNMADSQSLPLIIDELRIKTSNEQKAIVVIDAGIATEENLAILKSKNYDYVCVSRAKIKDYTVDNSKPVIKIKTKDKQELQLEKVLSEKHSDYILKIQSPKKALKENAMQQQFEERFLEKINIIQKAITHKHRTKQADKINQRIGRAVEKYPKAAKCYKIETQTNDKNIATKITCTKIANSNKTSGEYFIRTSLQNESEELIWTIYNSIREIENSFRTLKTELDLRPIYHKNDNATKAHLHLGILAYWLVNTVRYQLKSEGINYDWREIKRIAQTQKLVTIKAKNANDDLVIVQKSSLPNQELKDLFEKLNYKLYPFKKRKSVVHKPPLKKNETLVNQIFDDD